MTNIETKKLHELQKLIETTNKQLINHGNHQHKTQLKLTQSDKIAFAYDFYNLMGDVSLLDILINIPKDNETASIEFVQMPDITGWLLSDAAVELGKLGLFYETDGEGGVVNRQLPPAGTTLAKGDTIILVT